MTIDELIAEFPNAVERDLATLFPPGCTCHTTGSCKAFHPTGYNVGDLLRELKVKVPDDGR